MRAEAVIPAGGAERTALSRPRPPFPAARTSRDPPRSKVSGNLVAGGRAFGPGPTPGRPPARLKRQRPGGALGTQAQTLGGAAPSGRGSLSSSLCRRFLGTLLAQSRSSGLEMPTDDCNDDDNDNKRSELKKKKNSSSLTLFIVTSVLLKLEI